MAYLGRQAGQIGNYIRCNTITPDGSTTTFALTNVLDNTAVVPGTENSVLCSLSGVIQAPGSGNAFTISGSNIVFDSAPSSSDVVDFVIVLGNTIDIGTPSDGTVGMNQLSASGTKDATTFLRGDNSFQVVSTDVVGDTTPQLGGDLDAQGKDIQDTGYVSHRSPDATITQTLTVTVATKTTEHTAYGDGSSSGYVIDGHEGPHLQLSRGVYKFDTSDGTNSGHPFRFYEDEGKNIAFTSDVTTSGSGGSAGNHATLTIDDDTPTPLFYQCSSHANMGGRIDILGGKRRRLNITTDKTFSADGSDTTQTILANRTVDDILVFVNGVCLVPTDDYTISGTTLTYATAPANGAEVVIRYLG